MKPSVYIETTIPSYLVARPSRDIVLAGHQVATRDFWNNRRQDFDLFISSYVIDESRGGEVEMASRRLESLKGIPMLSETPESDALALRLIARLGLPQKAEADAYHHLHRSRALDGLPADLELHTHQQPTDASAHRRSMSGRRFHPSGHRYA